MSIAAIATTSIIPRTVNRARGIRMAYPEWDGCRVKRCYTSPLALLGSGRIGRDREPGPARCMPVLLFHRPGPIPTAPVPVQESLCFSLTHQGQLAGPVPAPFVHHEGKSVSPLREGRRPPLEGAEASGDR